MTNELKSASTWIRGVRMRRYVSHLVAHGVADSYQGARIKSAQSDHKFAKAPRGTVNAPAK